MKHYLKNYKHFGRCLFLENSTVRIICSLDFGPRILYYGFHDGENVFYEQPENVAYLTTDDGWRVYGGTRLWFAPESEKTYYPDNNPVEFAVHPSGVTLIQNPDPRLNLCKRIDISIGSGSDVTVEYCIGNQGDKEVRGSVWAVTSVILSGELLIPWNETTALPNPNRFVSIWNETSLSDPRLDFRKNCLAVKGTASDKYLKLGLNCSSGRVEYSLADRCFAKCFPVFTGESADGKINFEVFSCALMMEIESIGPLSVIEPGSEIKHIETWTLSGRKK